MVEIFTEIGTDSKKDFLIDYSKEDKEGIDLKENNEKRIGLKENKKQGIDLEFRHKFWVLISLMNIFILFYFRKDFLKTFFLQSKLKKFLVFTGIIIIFYNGIKTCLHEKEILFFHSHSLEFKNFEEKIQILLIFCIPFAVYFYSFWYIFVVFCLFLFTTRSKINLKEEYESRKKKKELENSLKEKEELENILKEKEELENILKEKEIDFQKIIKEKRNGIISFFFCFCFIFYIFLIVFFSFYFYYKTKSLKEAFCSLNILSLVLSNVYILNIIFSYLMEKYKIPLYKYLKRYEHLLLEKEKRIITEELIEVSH